MKEGVYPMKLKELKPKHIGKVFAFKNKEGEYTQHKLVEINGEEYIFRVGPTKSTPDDKIIDTIKTDKELELKFMNYSGFGKILLY